MRIAIPVEEKKDKAIMCNSFGRTPYYGIYDQDKKTFEFMDNLAASSPGGAGIKAAQSLVDQNVDVVIVPRCGQNAGDVLVAANISIYTSELESISTCVERYLDGQLSILDGFHPGHHGAK